MPTFEQPESTVRPDSRVYLSERSVLYWNVSVMAWSQTLRSLAALCVTRLAGIDRCSRCAAAELLEPIAAIGVNDALSV